MADDDPGKVPKKPSREVLEWWHKKAQLTHFMPPDIPPEERDLYEVPPRSQHDLLSGNYKLAKPRKLSRREFRERISADLEKQRVAGLQLWLKREIEWPLWKRVLWHGVLDPRSVGGFLVGIVLTLLVMSWAIEPTTR